MTLRPMASVALEAGAVEVVHPVRGPRDPVAEGGSGQLRPGPNPQP
jgi:hypothetical protein